MNSIHREDVRFSYNAENKEVTYTNQQPPKRRGIIRLEKLMKKSPSIKNKNIRKFTYDQNPSSPPPIKLDHSSSIEKINPDNNNWGSPSQTIFRRLDRIETRTTLCEKKIKIIEDSSNNKCLYYLKKIFNIK